MDKIVIISNTNSRVGINYRKLDFRASGRQKALKSLLIKKLLNR